MSYYTNPPPWAKDAIPTERGWVSPKNGELLVSCKLDMSKFEKPLEQNYDEVILDAPELESVSEKDEPIEESPVPVEPKSKKKREPKAPKATKA